MNNLKLKILSWMKKYLDRMYYNLYNLDRGPLVREMFPWIYDIWEYKHIETFVRNNSMQQISDLSQVAYSYYRWEVNTLISIWKIDEIKSLKWLLDFASTLREYKERVMIEWQDNFNI